MGNSSNIENLLGFISITNISNDSHLFGNYFCCKLLIFLETLTMDII